MQFLTLLMEQVPSRVMLERQKIEQLFGKVYSLAGVYKLLHRLGYNDLMPRPRHPDTDPAALEAFKKRSCPSAWLFRSRSAGNIAGPFMRCRAWRF